VAERRALSGLGVAKTAADEVAAPLKAAEVPARVAESLVNCITIDVFADCEVPVHDVAANRAALTIKSPAVPLNTTLLVKQCAMIIVY
jgi:hypothetical protein